MDLQYGPEYDEFRAEVRAFLKGWPLTGGEADLPEEEQERLFRQRGIEAGYVYRQFPREYGGSGQAYDALRENIIQEEYARVGAPGNSLMQGPGMLVPTLLEMGTEEQKNHFIPPTLRGDMKWCQGYSEPGSGSDLASLQAPARLEGDEWVINGQKIWTSNALEADFMFGLFRTEPEASKHAGISYLLVPMKQAGIDVRPLKQMTGAIEFYEVFFDNVRTKAENIVGQRGEGWQVSRATLKHERNLIGNPRMIGDQFDRLLELARDTMLDGRPAIEDEGIRRRLAEIEGFVRACETSNLRMLSATIRGEEMQAILPMMMTKLYSTDVTQMIMKAAYDLLGAEGLVEPALGGNYARENFAAGIVQNYLFSLGPAIAGGASNIQRNIIGERGLGLPRDPRPSS
ncbi:MAG: acyl-CoA dehydrogenase family protein [Myxococcota bacterium]|nr:acyl-CoA dehydrogenase family protein [Myxococcota bacterium]